MRDLLAGHLAKLVSGGLQGVYPDAFTGRALRPEGQYAIQSPVVLSQLAASPAAQILSFFVMETDSMVRAGRRLVPGSPREEAVKVVVSANAEVLNFASSRLAWILAKLEGLPGAEITPPRIGNFTSTQAFRIRGEEGIFLEFACPAQDLAFRFASVVQCV